MVGERGQRDADYPPAPVWEDIKYEHGGAFFSVDCAGQGELFEGLSIWEYEEYHRIQGTYPLISLSFANVKERDYDTACYRMRQLLMKQYEKASFLLDS